MKYNKSFTLIEVLVTVAIFALIITVTTGIFTSALKGQRRSLANQELLDEVSYITEYMSKALRMAKTDFDATCIMAGYNYVFSGPVLGFKNYRDECQYFYVEGATLKEQKIPGSINNLTSNNLQVNRFNVRIWGGATTGVAVPSDQDQARLTFFLDIEHKKEPVSIKIQTTVSQRELDVDPDNNP